MLTVCSSISVCFEHTHLTRDAVQGLPTLCGTMWQIDEHGVSRCFHMVIMLPRSVVCHVRRVVMLRERLVVAELGRRCASGVGGRGGVEDLVVVCEGNGDEEASENCVSNMGNLD